MSRKTTTSFFIKFLMIFMFSITVAIGMAMIFDKFFANSGLLGWHFIGNIQSNLMIGIFTLTFLVCFFGLVAKSLSSTKRGPSQKGLKAVRKERIITGKKTRQKWNILSEETGQKENRNEI